MSGSIKPTETNEEKKIPIMGIKAVKTSKLVPFGVYLINKHSLVNNNKLVVKYPSKVPHTAFPAQLVSETLKTLILKLLEEQKLDFKALQSLTKPDSDLFHSLIQKAQLDEQLGLSGYQQEEHAQRLKRFELLRGQVLAGNNAPELLKELKTIIITFMSSGRMKRAEGNQILFELDCLL